MRIILILFFCFAYTAMLAQQSTPCTTAGQNPSTAFPVCGTSTFSQTQVPKCGGRKMAFKSCPSTDLLTDINPFWYKFTCFESGSLAFEITPVADEDYDWELYDVTGRNTADVYTDPKLVIANNWSGETGKTGASSAGRQLFVCGGRGQPLFSQMPQLIKGHNYLLLVSYFSDLQSGYKLSFGGGTAVITDTTKPHMQKVEASCGGDVLRLKTNKKIKCSSIAANGSDFFVTPSIATTTGSIGINCSQQFDTDSIEIQLNASLPPGDYVLHIKKGTPDNNTLLDYCDNAIATTETVSFTVLPKLPTPMDSMAALACAPKELHLLFKKPMLCSSIASDGTDFLINGSYPVSISAAAGACTDGTTKEVVVTLSQPLQKAGSFQIVLQKGSDGNTLFDECTQQTPAGSAIPFSVKDTVNADFGYEIHYGCERDTVAFSYEGGNGVNEWHWNLDEGQQSNSQNSIAFYNVFNQPKTVQLVVSNGVCSDSTTQTIQLENYLKADFSVFEDNCPNEAVPFTSNAEGNIVSHSWSFGDGGASADKDPTHIYAGPDRQTTYNVRYTVTNAYGCQQTASKNISVYPSCYLAVPTAFTPNGDGRNDLFRVLNAVKAENLELLLFNRWGQLVFKTKDWKQGWDGRVDGKPQQTGVYIWLLRYTDRNTKRKIEQKGMVTLIR